MYFRCPSCTGQFDPSDTETYILFHDGEHTIQCPDCNYEFDVITSVSYTFESPALIEKELPRPYMRRISR